MRVLAHGPYGQFCFDEKRHPRITMFAGGSGITPIMSMLRYIADAAPATDITLLYGVRSEQDVIFEKELQGLQEKLPRLLHDYREPSWDVVGDARTY